MVKISIEKLKKKSRDKRLCVLISCKGLFSILKLHLEALKKQNLSLKLWFPVFLFWEKTLIENQAELFLWIQRYFPDSPFLFLPKDKACYELRNLAFECLSSSLLYFLDEDVLLKDPDHLARLVKYHEENPEWTAIGGSYLSLPACSFWGKTYNWLVQFWMICHQSPGKDFFPAGNLSVKNQGLFDRFYSPVGFGGEEIFFLKSIHKKDGNSVWVKELDAYHIAQHRFKDWLSRAWMHGKSLSLSGFNSQKLFSKASILKFFKQSGTFKIKGFALFYLLLTRLSCILTAKKANRA